MKSVVKMVAVTLALTGMAVAQERLEFDVASVKVNPNPPRGPMAISLRASLNHGTLTFPTVTFRNLIQQAYVVQRDEIVGCPNWCDTEWFEVIAKAEDPNATPEQVQTMLQTLLADRFKLMLHRDKRERSGYALVVGRSGSKLKPAKDEEVLGVTVTRNGYLWAFQKMPVAGLANGLATIARQPVVDSTGLIGVYDFTIDLTPSEPPEAARGGPAIALDPTQDFGRVSAAVEDQLGLRLDSRKITVESLIIDKVDRLSEN